MLEIVVGAAVFLLIVAVPQLRRAALSLLGLFAIIVAGSALFVVVVWAIYESKPWLIANEPVVVKGAPASRDMAAESVEAVHDELTSALAVEEEQRLREEERHIQEERLRIAGIAERARLVLEEDRKLAEQTVSHRLPVGIGGEFVDILAIRIPPWRDKQLAAAQKESIRVWLQSIGLSADETASIVTAKAWGALYDMWLAENPDVVVPRPPSVSTEVASVLPESEAPPPEAAAESAPMPSSQTEPEKPPARDPTFPPPEAIRRVPPRRPDVAPAPPPRQRPARRSEPEVGPFGY